MPHGPSNRASLRLYQERTSLIRNARRCARLRRGDQSIIPVTVEIREADGGTAVSFCESSRAPPDARDASICFKEATCASVAGEVIE
jgi:hypothetical protein